MPVKPLEDVRQISALLASVLDNPGTEALTPGYVEACLRKAGFEI